MEDKNNNEIKVSINGVIHSIDDMDTIVQMKDILKMPLTKEEEEHIESRRIESTKAVQDILSQDGDSIRELPDCSDELWKIIERSKLLTNFDSEKQYNNLYDIIQSYSDKDRESIGYDWRSICAAITSHPSFGLLHYINGGIVNEGDDGFFMDFGNWVVAQGKELCSEFMKNGSDVIIKYIKDNKISEQDYTYECFAYVFN